MFRYEIFFNQIIDVFVNRCPHSNRSSEGEVLQLRVLSEKIWIFTTATRTYEKVSWTRRSRDRRNKRRSHWMLKDVFHNKWTLNILFVCLLAKWSFIEFVFIPTNLISFALSQNKQKIDKSIYCRSNSSYFSSVLIDNNVTSQDSKLSQYKKNKKFHIIFLLSYNERFVDARWVKNKTELCEFIFRTSSSYQNCF